MKNFVLSLVILFGLNAQAAYTLPADATSLSSAVSVTLVKQEYICPVGAFCVSDGTRVTLDVGLSGCLDDLAPVMYGAVEDGNELHVYVSALNVARKASKSVKCIIAPSKAVELEFFEQYGKVTVHQVKLAKAMAIGADDYQVVFAENKVTKTEDMCPAGKVCKTNGTRVTVERMPSGCLDRQSDVVHASRVVGSNLHLFLGSFEINNKKSPLAICSQVMTEETFDLVGERGALSDLQFDFK